MDKNILIVIGRQVGSGGKNIATLLGSKLNTKVYDKELMAKAAEDSGFSKKLFEGSDEKRNLFSLAGFLTTGRFGLADNYVGDNELFKIQSEVIQKIADSGSAIFVGRCSDYILRERKPLSIFITSPMEVRRKNIAEREKLSLEDAEKYINKKERERESYYNFFTFGDWGKASNYDLCIDSSILGDNGTAEYILDFLKKKGQI